MTFDTTRDVVEPLATMCGKEKVRADRLEVLNSEAQARIDALEWLVEVQEFQLSLPQSAMFWMWHGNALEEITAMHDAARAAVGV